MPSTRNYFRADILNALGALELRASHSDLRRRHTLIGTPLGVASTAASSSHSSSESDSSREMCLRMFASRLTTFDRIERVLPSAGNLGLAWPLALGVMW